MSWNSFSSTLCCFQGRDKKNLEKCHNLITASCIRNQQCMMCCCVLLHMQPWRQRKKKKLFFKSWTFFIGPEPEASIFPQQKGVEISHIPQRESQKWRDELSRRYYSFRTCFPLQGPILMRHGLFPGSTFLSLGKQESSRKAIVHTQE